jgi:hypothetical protein
MNTYEITLKVDSKWLEAIQNLTSDVYEGEVMEWISNEAVHVTKQPTCADRIKDSLASLNEDLAKLADDSESDDNDDPALSVDTFKLVSVCLSYGGPSSYLEIKATEDNEIISVNYRFSDWFDTATLPVFESEPAYQYAEYIMEAM